jgi:hypothetical protein
MDNTQDKYVYIFDTVNDDIFSHGHTAEVGPKIFIARTTDVGETSKDQKSVRQVVDQTIGNLDAAAFLGDVKPNIIQIGLGSGRYTMRHLAGRRGEFSQKAGASSFLHFLGKLLHRLLRDNATFPPGERSFGVIERKKKFGPLPLPFLP